nr:MAG: TIGR00153 family protein [bacterium]
MAVLQIHRWAPPCRGTVPRAGHATRGAIGPGTADRLDPAGAGPAGLSSGARPRPARSGRVKTRRSLGPARRAIRPGEAGRAPGRGVPRARRPARPGLSRTGFVACEPPASGRCWLLAPPRYGHGPRRTLSSAAAESQDRKALTREGHVRSILGLFAKSPFGPLAEHTQRVHDTVVLIRPMMEAFLEGDWTRTQEIYERISRLEHDADVIKNDIRDHLPKSLFLPVDRGDVLLFLREQDRVADAAEDLGVLLTMRRTPTPPAMKRVVLDLVDSVIRTSEAWFEAAAELPTLQEASFAGAEVDKMMERIKRVSDLEWEADQRQATASKVLFEHEEEIGAVSVMMWMNILRVLGAVANHAENSADMLRLMMARR